MHHLTIAFCNHSSFCVIFKTKKKAGRKTGKQKINKRSITAQKCQKLVFSDPLLWFSQSNSLLSLSTVFFENFTARKVSQCGVFSGPYFSLFGLNTERYSVSLRIQSECRKI